jgi:hypothetical protein
MATLSTLKPQKPVTVTLCHCAELLKPHIQHACVFGSLNIEMIIEFRGQFGKGGVWIAEYGVFKNIVYFS